jgi:carbamoyl-phosphate synthase large subunit
MANIATRVMLGAKLSDMDLEHQHIPHYGVKEAVFPFNMFPEEDPVLGPEMRSTGEVLGMAPTFGLAYAKAQEAALSPLPMEGTVLITVTDRDKNAIVEVARKFSDLGFNLLCTQGTARFLEEKGINVGVVKKYHEGRPNLVDAIKNGEVQLLINTPSGKTSAQDDAYIRKAAIRHKVPFITTATAALAAVRGIEELRKGKSAVKSLQDYHGDIK